ncbi:unnamed protein product [Macrosiphum euphorbiae]|uniref:Uncharacterized protein n=1 Tax=Macrosiphum euphorbiae TaxID=13131 RepID=A0AAV0XN71_9HEMI|nr:unnamed protein product [Macrosiphum euphorbiae]
MRLTCLSHATKQSNISKIGSLHADTPLAPRHAGLPTPFVTVRRSLPLSTSVVDSWYQFQSPPCPGVSCDCRQPMPLSPPPTR